MNYIIAIKTLIEAIKQVEALMPDSQGKEKFDAAVTIVEAVVGSVEPMLPALMGIATIVVNGLRASGQFKAKA